MRLTCALTVVYLLVVPASAITTHAGDSIQVDFCGFELPEWAMRGNLSSSLIVEFYTDEAGGARGDHGPALPWSRFPIGC
jgi:hypothetical protein